MALSLSGGMHCSRCCSERGLVTGFLSAGRVLISGPARCHGEHMTEHEKPKADPTADFLAEVRPEETPWRVDRPAEVAEGAGPEGAGRPQQWQRPTPDSRSRV